MLLDSGFLREGLWQHWTGILTQNQEVVLADGRGQWGHGPGSPRAQAPGLGAAVRACSHLCQLHGPHPASQLCHTGSTVVVPAQHLRSQLAAAINTHGASSCGERNHTAGLWIPNLGSEAPQALCVTEWGGSPWQDVGPQIISAGRPAWQLSARLGLGRRHGEEH